MTLKGKSQLLSPQQVVDLKSDSIAAVTSKGRLLIFYLTDLPKLRKGQGNKIINIPKKERTAPDPEALKFLKILPSNSNLVIHAGKHSFTLSPGNQIDYTGKRGHRGKKLPRGFQKVHRIEIVRIDPVIEKEDGSELERTDE